MATNPEENEGKPPRILVVDDEEAVLRGIVRTLRGYEVDSASNGEEALARLRETPYDLLILDFKMPKMGGVELLKAAREDGVSLKKVLAVTASLGVVQPILKENVQVDRFLCKPFDVDELLDAVKGLVG